MRRMYLWKDGSCLEISRPTGVKSTEYIVVSKYTTIGSILSWLGSMEAAAAFLQVFLTPNRIETKDTIKPNWEENNIPELDDPNPWDEYNGEA